MEEIYDVVVVGGGAAGLAGALALARSRRSVLVIDAGQPRNAPAGHVHNYLGSEGTPPGQLLATGRAEVTAYGGHVVAGTVETATRLDDHFLVTMADGHTVLARRLLVTTGLVDELPDVPGLAQRWGRDVLHCPYCHGWEARDRRIGVLASGPLALHQALLWRQLSPHVMLLLHNASPLTPDQAEQLAARQIVVVEEAVAGLELSGDELTGVRLTSGEVVDLDVIAVGPLFRARTALLEGLGLDPVELVMDGQVIGLQIPADQNGATTVPGVWVAGNVADVRAQVIVSAGAGLIAGAAINADLVADETRMAVESYRQHARSMFGQDAWEERYRSKPQVWSGRPNAQLVEEVAALSPGRVLDVGCGEGGDAIWLAERGWQVTAIDISTTALQRGADRATAAGPDIAGRIRWHHVDLRHESPAEKAYDLVSSHFMHVPSEVRQDLYARLAGAVAPGGVLLIVGHHPLDLRTSAHRMHFPDMMFTPEQLVADLDPGEWLIVTAQTRPRSTVDHDGHTHTVHDTVLVARRR